MIFTFLQTFFNYFLSFSVIESVFVVADKEIHRLSPVPLEDQIEELVKSQRVDEVLMLLDRLQDLLPKDSYKVRLMINY